MKTFGLISRINAGWEELEPVIVGLMAMRKNFMLIGRHGTGKTRLAKILSRGWNDDGFVFYDATKDDLLSIAGIPDAEALKAGTLRFAAHQRSLWDKTTIVIDEITRAPRDTQNLWLEILEERTCFGLPLSYKSLIATANPESYAASFKLDEALLDRFYAVITVPDFKESIEGTTVGSMIDLAMAGKPVSAFEIEAVFASVRAEWDAHAVRDWMPQIKTWLEVFIPDLIAELVGDPYVSPRTFARLLPETVLAVASYLAAAENGQTRQGNPGAILPRAAEIAVEYGLTQKLTLDRGLVRGVLDSSRYLLEERGSLGVSLRERARFCVNIGQVICLLKEEGKKLLEVFSTDEFEQFLGRILRDRFTRADSFQDDPEELLSLSHILARLEYCGDTARQLESRIALALAEGTGNVLPLLESTQLFQSNTGDALVSARVMENIEIFKALVKGGYLAECDFPGVKDIKIALMKVSGRRPDAIPEELVTAFRSADLSGLADVCA